MREFVTALGLALIIEGLVYAMFAASMKRTLARLFDQPDEALRLMGLLTALAGLFMVWVTRG